MHPKLLESTIAQCRAYMEAGDCHGEAPPTERLIDAVVQMATDLDYYKGIAEQYTNRLLTAAGAAGPLGDPEIVAEKFKGADS